MTQKCGHPRNVAIMVEGYEVLKSFRGQHPVEGTPGD
jgi:hypothetical protein